MAPERVLQPLCVHCQHPRSFHGRGGRCRALGCGTCTAYVSPLTQRVSLPNAVPCPGQVWADNDPRRPGRMIRVISVIDNMAKVTVLTTTASHQTGSGVGAVKYIKVSRFKPTQTGYRLVRDV